MTGQERSDLDERGGDGRRKVPLGIRTGGKAWTQVHASIAAAALDILVEAGYRAFTVEAVAAAADVNRRTIYRHYPTKTDLAVSALRQLPTFAGWADMGREPKDRIRAMVVHGRLMGVRMPKLLATAITHQGEAPELLETLRDQVIEPRARVVAAWLEEGKAAGWIRPGATPAQVQALNLGLEMVEAAGLDDLGSGKRRVDAWVEALWQLLAVDP